MIRDCNTCFFHQPGGVIPNRCQGCLGASGYIYSLCEDKDVPVGPGEYLPFWKPKATMNINKVRIAAEEPDEKPGYEWPRVITAKGTVFLTAGSPKPVLPTDAAERKGIPIASGVLDYFPAALAEVAKLSKAGNDQHNPGQPLHWARGKSNDHADTLVRHLLERGTRDTDGMRHSAKLAWRALALLQMELEAEGAPIARGAK